MRKKGWLLDSVLDFTEILVISTTIFAVVYVFVGQLLEVSGNSMFPTYHDKEKMVAEKVSLKYNPIQRGEVVIFQHPNYQEKHLLIKRVIGLPGETLVLRNGLVYVNDEKLDEPYIESNVVTKQLENGLIKEGEEYEIPSDSYVLLGDNREQSTDSRYFGAVKRENIIGRPILVYYPLKSLRIAQQR